MSTLETNFTIISFCSIAISASLLAVSTGFKAALNADKNHFFTVSNSKLNKNFASS